MMNKQMNLPQIQRIMRDFEQQAEVMDLKEEMMNDAVDEAMEDEDGVGEEEQGDAILQEVLDEIGVTTAQELKDAPSGSLAQAEPQAPTRVAIGEGVPEPHAPHAAGAGHGLGASDEDELQARLDSLRRD